MGKWPFEMLAELFLKHETASDDRSFFFTVLGKKTSSRQLRGGRRRHSSTDIEMFDVREHNCTSAGNRHFGA